MRTHLPRALVRSASIAIGALLILAAPVADAGKRKNKVANVAPVIAGQPAATAYVGKTYEFVPSASDANGNALTFSIRNRPAWAAFNTLTGAISGTPTATGTYPNIQIRVSDGKLVSALPVFTVVASDAPAAPKTPTEPTPPIPVPSPPDPVPTPASVNHAPTIGGSAVTSGRANQPYAFQPSASDVDGDTLTFSISNKPAWATFDPQYGTLYGTPSSDSLGTYADVTISVSDGKLSSALPAFAITVEGAPTKAVTISWVKPVANTDGTALGDLAGYRISYGNAAGQYTRTVNVADAALTSAVLEGLSAGTWYFIVTAINAAGIESDCSGEVSAAL